MKFLLFYLFIICSIITAQDVVFREDFNTEPLGVYTEEQVRTAWNSPPWTNGIEEERVEIVEIESGEQALRVSYPEGGFGPGDGGAQWILDLDSLYDTLWVSYHIQLPEDFDWVRGGKLPGLAGGEIPSGGDDVTGEEGFSARIMWRDRQAGEDNLFQPALCQYMYHMDKTGDYGEDLFWAYPNHHWSSTRRYLVPGQWHELKTRIIMNTPGEHDGRITSWLDGDTALDSILRFRAAGADHFANDKFYFSTFFGGGDARWAPVKDEHILFDQFIISTIDPDSIDHGDDTYTLSTTAAGNGEIIRAPHKDEYTAGETVSLTAAADAEHIFSRWSGARTGTKNPVEITMDENTSLTAHFSPDTQTGPLLYHADWSAEADEYGSIIDTGESIVQDGYAGLNYTVAEQPDDQTWPWIRLSAGFENSLHNLSHITIRYSSADSLTLSLDHPSLTDEGATYGIPLPPQEEYNDTTVAVGDFTQPEWVETPSPLALDSVFAISLSPHPRYESPTTGDLAIAELIFHGVGWSGTAIADKNRDSFGKNSLSFAVRGENLQVSLAVAGRLSLFDIRGRRVHDFGGRAPGQHRLFLAGKNLPAGLYILDLTKDGTTERLQIPFMYTP
ncbi:MAG: polysaccharide lyase [Fibrobacterota bacterium]